MCCVCILCSLTLIVHVLCVHCVSVLCVLVVKINGDILSTRLHPFTQAHVLCITCFLPVFLCVLHIIIVVITESRYTKKYSKFLPRISCSSALLVLKRAGERDRDGWSCRVLITFETERRISMNFILLLFFFMLVCIAFIFVRKNYGTHVSSQTTALCYDCVANNI